jgi:hypothetical protein
MDTQTGELTQDELSAKLGSMTDEQKAELNDALEALDKPEVDKYSTLPESERPIAKAFEEYLSKRRRVSEPRTQRQAFYAGYQAALSGIVVEIKPEGTGGSGTGDT